MPPGIALWGRGQIPYGEVIEMGPGSARAPPLLPVSPSHSDPAKRKGRQMLACKSIDRPIADSVDPAHRREKSLGKPCKDSCLLQAGNLDDSGITTGYFVKAFPSRGRAQ